MIRMISTGAAALMLASAMVSAEPARAQDPLAGAIIGGAIGAGVGAAVGRGRGALIGGAIGAGTGAVIATQRPAYGYDGYWWDGGACWYQYPNGQVTRVPRRYCY